MGRRHIYPKCELCKKNIINRKPHAKYCLNCMEILNKEIRRGVTKIKYRNIIKRLKKVIDRGIEY